MWGFDEGPNERTKEGTFTQTIYECTRYDGAMTVTYNRGTTNSLGTYSTHFFLSGEEIGQGREGERGEETRGVEGPLVGETLNYQSFLIYFNRWCLSRVVRNRPHQGALGSSMLPSLVVWRNGQGPVHRYSLRFHWEKLGNQHRWSDHNKWCDRRYYWKRDRNCVRKRRRMAPGMWEV